MVGSTAIFVTCAQGVLPEETHQQCAERHAAEAVVPYCHEKSVSEDKVLREKISNLETIFPFRDVAIRICDPSG